MKKRLISLLCAFLLLAAAGTAQAVQAVPGRYFSDAEGQSTNARHTPRLILDDDGKASLRENLFQGMGHYYGKWERAENTITLTVTGIDFAGFAGDDAKKIVFEETDAGLVLRTDLCFSSSGDVFVPEKPRGV